jgi:3'(2'), 5'-bisphosphate nucleotidase
MRFNAVSSQLVNDVLEISQEASARVMAIYRQYLQSDESAQGIRLDNKDDNSPLTQADLAAHSIITESLRKLTPHIPVVSEEDTSTNNHRQPQGTFWLIDPLDGTKEFLARSGDFTVNIALIQDSIAMFGVVEAPALDAIYWGGDSLGAFRREKGVAKAIRVSPRSQDDQRPIRVAASKSHMNPETARFIEQLGPHELIQIGSSMKFCKIAEGAIDCYPRMGPTCEWDTAAAQAVVEAAGGYVSKVDGTPLRYGKPDILNPHFVVSAVPLGSLIQLPAQ